MQTCSFMGRVSSIVCVAKAACNYASMDYTYRIGFCCIIFLVDSLFFLFVYSTSCAN